MKIKHQRGFTLIEIVVVLFLAILLVAWGVPQYRDLKLRQELTGYANEMIYSFTLARAEAVRRGVSTSIAQVGGSWQEGWQVINLSDNSILAEQDAFNEGFQLDVVNGGADTVVFDNTGALTTPPVAYELRHGELSEGARRIQVSAAGSARVTKI